MYRNLHAETCMYFTFILMRSSCNKQLYGNGKLNQIKYTYIVAFSSISNLPEIDIPLKDNKLNSTICTNDNIFYIYAYRDEYAIMKYMATLPIYVQYITIHTRISARSFIATNINPTHRGCMYYSPVIISANNSEAMASSLSAPSAACVGDTGSSPLLSALLTFPFCVAVVVGGVGATS